MKLRFLGALTGVLAMLAAPVLGQTVYGTSDLQRNQAVIDIPADRAPSGETTTKATGVILLDTDGDPITTLGGDATAANQDEQTLVLERIATPLEDEGTAAGAALTANPVTTGCRASSTLPTAVDDGDVVNKRCDLYGNTINWPYAARANLTAGLTASMTATTTTAVTGMGAPGSGLYNYITSIVCGNSDATVSTFVDLQDGSGGSVFFTVPAAAVYGGVALTLPAPLKQPTSNTALYAVNKTTSAEVICSFVGFKAP